MALEKICLQQSYVKIKKNIYTNIYEFIIAQPLTIYLVAEIAHPFIFFFSDTLYFVFNPNVFWLIMIGEIFQK